MMKRSSLISIVNRLYLNANEQNTEMDVEIDESNFLKTETADLDGSDAELEPTPEIDKSPKSQTSMESLSISFSSPVMPLTSETVVNGLNAIGGCRQCSRTFSDRLSLIHHFIDHFPSIFYSFESQNLPPTSGSLSFQFPTKMPMMLYPLSAALATQTNDSRKSPENLSKKGKNGKIKTKLEEKKLETSEKPSRFTDFNANGRDLPYDMCPHCCQTFSDHGLYMEHVKIHETPIISLGSPIGTTMKCEYCDLRFSNEYLLKEHKQIHCRVCSICCKTLMTAFDFNLHMGSHCGFNFDCKDCGRCFPDRKTLAIHNKLHRSELSSQNSDDQIVKEQLPKEKKPSKKEENAKNDKPESFFKANPYFENIFKESAKKRRHRSKVVEDKFIQSKPKKKK